MQNPAYTIHRPKERTSSVVFASPHSARAYPKSFLEKSVLDEHAIRSSEDAFVDKLFGAAPDFGAPLIVSTVPRAYVDLNRSPDEFDPALITGARMQAHNPRIASGLGVIPRVVSNGRAIYRGKISMNEARMRIDTYWRPYHEALHALMSEARGAFGEVVLIDCHSMPHEAMDGVARKNLRRPEIVLGDRFGASSSVDVVDQVEDAFAQAGFTVARNTPFAGAYVTQVYGRPSRNQHAIQVEIDRSLYMDERRIEPKADFDDFKTTLSAIVGRIAQIGLERPSLAAE